MEAKNVTIQDLEQALTIVNSNYDGNLTWASQPRHVGQTTRSRVSFRLAAIDCRKQGGRRGFCRNKDGERRRIGGCACWHAHGHFFEALYTVNSKAIISTAGTCQTGLQTGRYNDSERPITGPTYKQGNWRDRQVGSMFDPAYFSDLCDCEA